MMGAPLDDSTRVGARVEVIDLEAPAVQDHHISVQNPASLTSNEASSMQPHSSSTWGEAERVVGTWSSSLHATSRKRAGEQLDFQMMD